MNDNEIVIYKNLLDLVKVTDKVLNIRNIIEKKD